MNELRSELRAAFEEEQAMNPPAANLRHTIVRAVRTQQPRREPRWQWAAVAAALLIGALVVAGLLSSRLARLNVPGHRQPSPSPGVVTKPVTELGPPPAGVPLFYLGDPSHPGWYVGFDWSGRPRGTIKLAQPLDANASLGQAPDGSAFAGAQSAKGGYQQFLDRLGNPVPNQDTTTRFQDQIWADDSRQLCTLEYDTQTWHIGLRSPGGLLTNVHAVAIDDSVVRSGIIAIRFIACSPQHDRALLFYGYFGRPTEVWVIRISDGAILFRQSQPANELADIAASPDGSLIALNSNQSTGYLLGGTAPNTAIRRTSDDSLVLSLDPTEAVVAFSADDSLALVTTSPWASGVATHLALINLQSGSSLWRYDGNEELAGFWVEPGGGGFAVMLKRASDQGLHASIDVIIVRPDGSSTALPGRFVRP